MKKQLSLILALVMILGTFTTAFAATDADAIADSSAFLKEKGILVGNMAGDLMLDENLSRQDTAILVSRLMGEYDVAKNFPTAENIPTYNDIDDPFYLPVLAWAQANKTFVGHSDARFGFDDNVTAQEYAKVLLVALGYEVGPETAKDLTWEATLPKAKDLGILKDIDTNVKNTDEITRGEMAVMTFNALSVMMKDGTKTLAEELGITMPAATKLTATVNDTKNLKEVVIELSNAKLADEAKLLDTNNYRVDGKVAERVTLDGNNVIVELKDVLTEDKEYELKVRSIHSNVDGTYKFVARDNSIPMVEDVVVLGKYGIKVVLSEPVDTVYGRDFLIDGRNVSLNADAYGRNVILTPYTGTFSNDIKELTVRGLEDFAGFKSAQENFDIEMVNDTVAPKVTDVVVKGDIVEVTFDKDIYKSSVKKSNASYNESRRTFDADSAKKIDINKAEYDFDNALSRYGTVTIEGVQNHSGVAMERTTQDVREVIDYTEPEVIETDVSTDMAGVTTIELSFNKEVKGDLNDFEEHFTVYNYGAINSRNELKRGIGEDFTATFNYENGGTQDDVIIVKLEGLKEDNDKKETEYVLEVKNFEDARSARNIMFRHYVDFKVEKEENLFKVKDIKTQAASRNKTEIVIEFNNAVDRRTADLLENYEFSYKVGTKIEDLRQLNGSVQYEGGKKVVLTLDTEDFNKLETLTIARVLKDTDGNRLGKDVVYNFVTGVTSEQVETLEQQLATLVTKANTAPYNADSDVMAALNMPTTTYAQKQAAVKALQDAINAVDRADELEIEEARLQAAITISQLSAYTGNTAEAVQVRLLGAEAQALLINPARTAAQVKAKAIELENAIEIADATMAVATAESSKTDANRTTAQNLVTALPAGSVKVALQNRLDAITTEEDTARAAVAVYEGLELNTDAKIKAAVEYDKTLLNSKISAVTDATNRAAFLNRVSLKDADITAAATIVSVTVSNVNIGNAVNTTTTVNAIARNAFGVELTSGVTYAWTVTGATDAATTVNTAATGDLTFGSQVKAPVITKAPAADIGDAYTISVTATGGAPTSGSATGTATVTVN